MSRSECVKMIKELKNKNTFYEDVRNIIGYYDEKVFWEDCDIKYLQRIADKKYSELEEVA